MSAIRKGRPVLAVGAVALVAPVVGMLAPTAAGAAVPAVVVSEVAPWGSGTAAYGADWFELTNNDTVPVTITGWKLDDNSNLFSAAVALNGVTTIQPGQSAIFVEGTAPGAVALIATGFVVRRRRRIRPVGVA